VLRVISTSVPTETPGSLCVAGGRSALVGAPRRLTRHSKPSPAGLRRHPGRQAHGYRKLVRHSTARVGAALTVNWPGKAGEDR